MSLTLDKLVFDASSADTILASSNVGAYVRGSDGTLITHTTVSAKEALDVYVANDIDVTIDGIYNAGTNPDPDNVGLISHVRGASPADADQTFRSTGGAASSDSVVAANVHGIDVNSFLMGYNGTTWDRLLKANKDLRTADFLTEGMAQVNVAVSDTEVALPTTALTNRKKIIVQNIGARSVFIGKTGVLTTSGLRLSPGSNIELALGAAQTLYGIAETGVTCNVRVFEAS